MSTVVETASGRLKGARSGATTIFRGIPYGGSVSGIHRFKPPRKPDPWPGVRDALSFGPVCPQDIKASQPDPSTLFGQVFDADPSMLNVDEDCLFLNVWMPAGRTKRPVMVWLHGGGFARGCGSTPVIDGSRLSARGDVVVVTMNHRLNVFGYLDLSSFGAAGYEESGNAGMLDIVLALEWVRENISAFGGDPGNVTIFGESGGGGKVLAVLAMPGARGLFHRAIVQSGPFVHANTRGRAARTADVLLSELGFTAFDLHQIERVSPQRLMEAALATEGRMQGARVLDGTMGCWQPVLHERLLPHHPGDPESHALMPEIPLMIGTTKDELAMHFGLLPNFQALTLDEAGQIASLVTGAPMSDALAFYRTLKPNESPGYLMTDLLGDLGAWRPTVALAEGRAKYAVAAVFNYIVGWETPVMGGRFRSPHALDIPLMFDNVDLMRKFVGDGPEPQVVADAMSEAWLAFARTGDPNNPLIPTWPAYEAKRRSSMIFNLKSEVIDDYKAPVRAFWDGCPKPAPAP